MDFLLTLPQAGAFLAVAVLVTLAPGPDNLMVLSLGLSRGRLAGTAFGLGCALGCLSHTLLAALGVSALIAASPWAFMGLRMMGGVYLVWLGVRAWRRARPYRNRRSVASTEGTGLLFARGLIANAINPKVVLFFLAFLPQFVDAGRGGAGWQIAQLGLVFTLETVIIFGAIGGFAGHLGQWLSGRPAVGAWLDRSAAVLFIALGLRLIADL